MTRAIAKSKSKGIQRRHIRRYKKKSVVINPQVKKHLPRRRAVLPPMRRRAAPPKKIKALPRLPPPKPPKPMQVSWHAVQTIPEESDEELLAKLNIAYAKAIKDGKKEVKLDDKVMSIRGAELMIEHLAGKIGQPVSLPNVQGILRHRPYTVIDQGGIFKGDIREYILVKDDESKEYIVGVTNTADLYDDEYSRAFKTLKEAKAYIKTLKLKKDTDDSWRELI